MRHGLKMGCLALSLALLAQLACEKFTEIDPETFCEMQGGQFIRGEFASDSVCFLPFTATPVPRESPNVPRSSPEVPSESPTGEYLTPTPAPVQECNATLYLQLQSEIVRTTDEQYLRECDYRLAASNIHPSAGIWVVRRTNISIHSTALDTEERDWYSDLLFPGQSWEQQFHSSFYTDGQTSLHGVDRVAGVFDRPECIYLLTSPVVESISQPVECMCAPYAR